MTEIRLTRKLYAQIRGDLSRMHRFAHERVGFALGKVGSQSAADPLILFYDYRPVPDDQYVDDPFVGARIDGSAITNTMQEVMDLRSKRVGAFHIHMHSHPGRPGLSKTDKAEIPLLIPSFQSVARESAHGLIVLSDDYGIGWIWLPGHKVPSVSARIVVVGAPLEIFEA